MTTDSFISNILQDGQINRVYTEGRSNLQLWPPLFLAYAVDVYWCIYIEVYTRPYCLERYLDVVMMKVSRMLSFCSFNKAYSLTGFA